MASQTSGFPPVEFSITQPFTNVRLLELPDDLLKILEAESPSTPASSPSSQPAFRLVSGPAPATQNGNSAKEGFLHLCTADKVWAVKQVSTSNSVYVCRPGSAPPSTATDPEHDEVDTRMGDDTVIAPSGLTAFAKPTNLLELHHVTESTLQDTALRHLEVLLATSTWDADLERPVLNTKEELISMSGIYSHVPVPTNILADLLAKKCAIDLSPAPGEAVRAILPSAQDLLTAWRLVVDAATSSDLSLSDVSSSGGVLANGAPNPLTDVRGWLNQVHPEPKDLHAYFVEIASQMMMLLHADAHEMLGPGQLQALKLLTTSKGHPTSFRFNEMQMARYVGALALNAHTRTKPTLVEEGFIKTWEEAVPAQWMKYCSLEILEPVCKIIGHEQQEGGRQVGWGDGSQFLLEPPNNGNRGEEKPSSSGAVGKKRKWHEKFVAQREKRV